MTKLFKNSKSVLSVALALAVLAVSLFTGVVINTEAACASSEGVIDTLVFDDAYIDAGSDSKYYDSVLIDSTDGSETGESWEKAIIIDSAEELSYLTQYIDGATTKGKYYKVADGIKGFDMSCGHIDFDGTLEENLATVDTWGNHSASANNAFQGHFDGNGATVYGLRNRDTETAGLFPYAKGNVTIKNVNVSLSYLKARQHAGGIVGRFAVDFDITNNALIIDGCSVTDCHLETTESGSNDVGNATGAIYGGARNYASWPSTVEAGPITVNNCFINLDEDHFISVAETAAEQSVHGGIGGVAVSGLAISTNCVVIGISPYATSNPGYTATNDKQHTSRNTAFENIYTDATVPADYNGRITQLSVDQMKGAAAVENMDLDWSVWLANPNGYPELRSAHKGATLSDNHDGTHSITCGCGVYGPSADHVYVDGVCECGAELNCAAKKTIYWEGGADSNLADGDSNQTGADADHAIIIDSAEELAYLVRDTSIRDYAASVVTVEDKYYKIADGIGAIVLQPKAYVEEIMALDSAADVKNYFSDTSKTFLEWAGCEGWETGSFAGTFDGNGVTIYGLYGDPNSTNGNKGLFSTVDAGATFKNFTIKNAYLHTTKANFNVGAIACVACDGSYGDIGDGFIWADRCAVVNSYIRNDCESWTRSGIMFGTLSGLKGEAAYFDNCFVYGNDAAYGPNDTPMAILGSARNNISDETAVKIPNGLEPVKASDGLYRSMVRNSIVIGATPYIAAADSYRVNDKDSFVNVYTDAEVVNAAANVTYEENQIKKLSAIDGATIAAEAENLDWNNVWFAADMPAFRDAHDDVLSAEPYADDNYAGHVEACSCGLTSLVVEHDYVAGEEYYHCTVCSFDCYHDSEEHIKTTPVGGDCLTAGSIKIECDCGFEATVPTGTAPGHDFTFHEEDPSDNCQTNGTEAYNYCPNCDKKYAADAGDFEPFENAIDDADLVLPPAACSPLAQLGWDNNDHWQVCETCGEIIEGSVTSHTGAWEADLVDPTSGHTGACADDACGYVANDVVPHGFGDDNVCDQCFWACEDHNFVPDEENGVIAEGDCITDRVVATYCSICGIQGENDVTTAPGHTNGNVNIENEIPADCVTDGSYDEVIYCTVCSEEVSRTNVPDLKTGHDFDVYEESAPTCVWTGEKAHVWCHVCGNYFAADHDLEDIYSEAYLDYNTEVSIDADPEAHGWHEVEATDATCDEAGNIAYTYCEYCDTVVIGDDEYVAEIDYDKFWEDLDAVLQPEWEKFIAENEQPGEDATEEEYKEFMDAWNAIMDPIYESMYKQALIEALAEEVEIAVEALGHDLKEVAEVAATTEKEGTKAHWVCEECDKLYADKDGKTEVTAEELVIAKLAKVEDNKTENTDNNTESPKTGETVATVVAAVAAIVAAGYVLVRKARKA